MYRYFGGHCFRFHPLANFGVLNARATSGDVEGTQELADALVARGVYQKGGGIGWEYDFPFSGGKAPWLSGMAQAVAAQAFSRAATIVPENATDVHGRGDRGVPRDPEAPDDERGRGAVDPPLRVLVAAPS